MREDVAEFVSPFYVAILTNASYKLLCIMCTIIIAQSLETTEEAIWGWYHVYPKDSFFQ